MNVDMTLLKRHGFAQQCNRPRHTANMIGSTNTVDNIERFAKEDPHLWQVAPLLGRPVEDDRSFASLNTLGDLT